jgi:hypothetical protein
METVINQHGLDIEALRLSRLPLTGGNQIGDSASAQFAGTMLLVKLELILKKSCLGVCHFGLIY